MGTVTIDFIPKAESTATITNLTDSRLRDDLNGAGAGTTNTQAEFTAARNAQGGGLGIARSLAGIVGGEELGSLVWLNPNTGAGADAEMASIVAVHQSAASNAYLSFRTRPSSTPLEQMVLTAEGRLAIGKPASGGTDPLLDVGGSVNVDTNLTVVGNATLPNLLGNTAVSGNLTATDVIATG